MSAFALAFLLGVPTDIPMAATRLYTGEEAARLLEEMEQMELQLQPLEEELEAARRLGEALAAKVAETQDLQLRRQLQRQWAQNVRLVDALQPRVDHLAGQIQDLGMGPVELDPVLDRMLAEVSAWPPLATTEDARRLNELYSRDWEDTGINRAWGDMILDHIEAATSEEDLSAETVRVLREGLLQYYNAQLRHHGNGGRAVSPYWMAERGAMLLRVSPPGDAETERLVESIKSEAVQWANELHLWEDAFEYDERLSQSLQEWREMQTFHPSWGAGDVPVQILVGKAWVSLSPEEARRQILTRLKQLERGRKDDVEKIAKTFSEIEQLALADWKDGQVNEGMRTLFFFGMRRLLRQDRTPTQARLAIVDLVDRCLAACAEMDLSRKEREKWAEAVSALGQKASRRLRDLVYERLTKPGEEKELYAKVWDAIRE